MNKHENLESKLHLINEVIKKKYQNNFLSGALAGLSGVSLFQFYYSRFTGNDENASFGKDILSMAIEKVNEKNIPPTYCSGLAGLGWILDHLKSENFLEFDNDSFLSPIDDVLYDIMIKMIKEGNYDFLHGSLGYAFYFLKRYQTTNSQLLKNSYRDKILKFIHILSSLALLEDNTKIKFISNHTTDNQKETYDLSLSHGMSSIIAFLTKIQEIEDFSEFSVDLLEKSIQYVISFKKINEDAISLFPTSVSAEGENRPSRLAWCYGDLGIGVTLFNASKVLNNPLLLNSSLEILEHSTKRRKFVDTFVNDSSICHGSFGNALIYNKMYKETGREVFKNASDYWVTDGMNKAIHRDGYAGFMQWNNRSNTWYPSISVLEGVAGIGLTIIDYLTADKLNWNECLLIN